MREGGVDCSMDCVFCEEYKEGDLLLMMTDAVYAKHAINQSESHIGYIDAIMRLQEPANKEDALACCRHHEYAVLDEADQFLKRQYSSTEYEAKITMLTEYYKFHANIPRVVEPSIERVLGRYHDKKREFDYRRIKKQLKEEQGISITSVQESESDFSDSAVEKKSRYSTLLNELEESGQQKNTGMSDSNLLKDLCKQIERVLPSRKKDANFQIKGAFYHDTIFEKFLKREQMRTREKLRLRNQDRKNSIANPRRLNLNIYSERTRKENPRKSKELKRKEGKEGKPVYNTNIKIQIKNAMFCTEEHFKNVNFESEGSASKNIIRHDVFKKRIMNPLNFFETPHPSTKFLTQVYRPAQNDSSKRKIAPAPALPTQHRTNTKESLNRSQSRDRRKSKQSLSHADLKKTAGSNSARKIVFATSEVTQQPSKLPSRALSSTNLKSRSLSSQSVSASASLASSAYKKQSLPSEKRPIELISKYGSSNLREGRGDSREGREKRSEQKMHEAISRKLTLKAN